MSYHDELVQVKVKISARWLPHVQIFTLYSFIFHAKVQIIESNSLSKPFSQLLVHKYLLLVLWILCSVCVSVFSQSAALSGEDENIGWPLAVYFLTPVNLAHYSCYYCVSSSNCLSCRNKILFYVIVASAGHFILLPKSVVVTYQYLGAYVASVKRDIGIKKWSWRVGEEPIKFTFILVVFLISCLVFTHQAKQIRNLIMWYFSFTSWS